MPSPPARERSALASPSRTDPEPSLRVATGDGAPAVRVYPDAAPAPSAAALPSGRQLPAHKGKVGRISDHVTALTDDLKAWVDLRVDLVKAEVEEQIESVKGWVAVGLVAAIGGLFLLLFLAFFIGWLLGEDAWGFGIVTLLLFATAGVLYLKMVRPHQERVAQGKKARYLARHTSGSPAS